MPVPLIVPVAVGPAFATAGVPSYSALLVAACFKCSKMEFS
jgi:hypothetical protein